MNKNAWLSSGESALTGRTWRTDHSRYEQTPPYSYGLTGSKRTKFSPMGYPSPRIYIHRGITNKLPDGFFLSPAGTTAMEVLKIDFIVFDEQYVCD